MGQVEVVLLGVVRWEEEKKEEKRREEKRPRLPGQDGVVGVWGVVVDGLIKLCLGYTVVYCRYQLVGAFMYRVYATIADHVNGEFLRGYIYEGSDARERYANVEEKGCSRDRSAGETEDYDIVLDLLSDEGASIVGSKLLNPEQIKAFTGFSVEELYAEGVRRYYDPLGVYPLTETYHSILSGNGAKVPDLDFGEWCKKVDRK